MSALMFRGKISWFLQLLSNNIVNMCILSNVNSCTEVEGIIDVKFFIKFPWQFRGGWDPKHKEISTKRTKYVLFNESKSEVAVFK